MSLSALLQLNIRQLQSYNFQLCIYRQDPNVSGTGKVMYRNAVQGGITLIGIPFIFEPTVNTDEFVGQVGLSKIQNIFTLNPADLPVNVDVRDGDKCFVNVGLSNTGSGQSFAYALPWFSVSGEPKQRPNAGLRTANYQRVLLDPAVEIPPLVSGTIVPPEGVWIPVV